MMSRPLTSEEQELAKSIDQFLLSRQSMWIDAQSAKPAKNDWYAVAFQVDQKMQIGMAYFNADRSYWDRIEPVLYWASMPSSKTVVEAPVQEANYDWLRVKIGNLNTNAVLIDSSIVTKLIDDFDRYKRDAVRYHEILDQAILRKS
jgi:hypothetical protein